MSSDHYAAIAGDVADEGAAAEVAFHAWLDEYARGDAEDRTAWDQMRSAYMAGLGQRGTATPEQMLREFHTVKAIHGGLMPPFPTADIPGWVRDLRMALLDEEVQELREAVAEGDIVKIADALGDIEHVTRGTAVAYGIPSDAVFAEIFRSNMTKDNSPAEGKLVKGPGYEAPDIAGVLGQGTEDRRHVPADVNGRDRLAAVREYRIYVDEDGDGIRMHGPCAETIGCLFGRLFNAYPSMREDISLGQVIDAALAHEREKEQLHADQLRREREFDGPLAGDDDPYVNDVIGDRT